MRSSLLISTLVYAGLAAALLCAVWAVRSPPARGRALGMAGASLLVVGLGLILPAPGSRNDRPTTRLDEFLPAWQFREFHSLRIDVPPARVFEAVKRVRADEILFFHTLMWLRRGGRPQPESLREAGEREALIDVATHRSFVLLAEDAPRELVIGTRVAAPPGPRERLTPRFFLEPVPPGYALAAMNFLVTPDGAGGSLVSTETRVFASSPAARRRFAAYWRVIYPGSALIRRMWLRAIERRATAPDAG